MTVTMKALNVEFDKRKFEGNWSGFADSSALNPWDTTHNYIGGDYKVKTDVMTKTDSNASSSYAEIIYNKSLGESLSVVEMKVLEQIAEINGVDFSNGVNFKKRIEEDNAIAPAFDALDSAVEQFDKVISAEAERIMSLL